MNFINKIQKFMYGRYGLDDLYKFLFKIYFIILILDLFIDFKYFIYIELFIVIVMFYRFYSKNIYKRSKENQQFLKLKNNILKPFNNINRNIKDKNSIYKKCSKCKTILKLPLPNSRGIKHAKCPNCKSRVSLLALRKQKVEIIKT